MIKEYRERRSKRIFSALFNGFWLTVAVAAVSLMLLAAFFHEDGVFSMAGNSLVVYLSLTCLSGLLYIVFTVRNNTTVQLYPEELLILCRGQVRHRFSLVQQIEVAQFGRWGARVSISWWKRNLFLSIIFRRKTFD